MKARVKKTILDRKNAKEVLELLNSGMNVNQISKKLGIWFNVANFLAKELKAANLVSLNNENTIDFKSILKSSRKNVLIEMLESGVVSQKAIVNRIGLSRLPADMLEDLRELEKLGLIQVQVKGVSKLYQLN